MKNLILFMLLFCSFSLFAQTERYIPIQGELFEDGAAVNEPRTLTFTIDDSGINWSEIHTDVQITEGLYAVTLGTINSLPDNLFKDQSSHQLEILVEGNPLDIVTIYAVIENDPTVPEDLKDGIDWTEVSSKPADLNTDELQLLYRSDDTLFISGGNHIILPENEIGSTLFVGEIDTISYLNISNSGGLTAYNGNSVWQSFKPTVSGYITKIGVEFDNTSNSPVTLKFYNGEGSGSQANPVQPYTSDIFPSSGTGNILPQEFKDFPLFYVTAGQTYTFEVIGETSGLAFNTSGTTNSYINGKTNIDDNTDLNFLIYIQHQTSLNFLVESNGTVSAPNGRIKDKNGYVTPVGVVLPFMGSSSTPPDGWLFCNGSLVDKNEYADLHAVIGNAGGNDGTDPNKFRIPDLRGAFVRGWNAGSGNDPDASDRKEKYSNEVVGDKPGSYQNSATGPHEHDVKQYNNSGASSNLYLNRMDDDEPYQILYNNIYVPEGTPTSLYGPYKNVAQIGTAQNDGPESRPYNVSAIYIIKY